MLRRLLGAWLGILLIAAAGWSVNPDGFKKESLTLRFEASYVSLDPVEDAGDTSHRSGASTWSSHEKIAPKLFLGLFLRSVRLIEPAAVRSDLSVNFRTTHHDKFQYHEVWRI
jgi:hypothetical protein